MNMTIVGCSGSFPGPDSAASCYLAEADGYRMLVDLGNGSLGALQRYVSPDQIDAVCLSHLHADHCLDMCGYQVFRTYHPSGPLPPIPVYAPAGAAARLSRAMAVEPTTAITPVFDFVTLAPGTVEIGPFTVTAEHMNHPVETFGLRIEHGGRAIAYSADTGPSAALVRLAAEADVLLCEASFADIGGWPENSHLTARQAGEHASSAGVGALILTHLVPWNDPEDSLARAAAAYSGPVSLARPGVEVTAAPE